MFSFISLRININKKKNLNRKLLNFNDLKLVYIITSIYNYISYPAIYNNYRIINITEFEVRYTCFCAFTSNLSTFKLPVFLIYILKTSLIIIFIYTKV